MLHTNLFESNVREFTHNTNNTKPILRKKKILRSMKRNGFNRNFRPIVEQKSVAPAATIMSGTKQNGGHRVTLFMNYFFLQPSAFEMSEIKSKEENSD